MGFGEDFFLDLVEGCVFREQVREEALHAVNGPEEIDGGGARCGQAGADALELGGEQLRREGGGSLDAKGDAVSGGDADGGRAADDHGDDNLGHLFIGGGQDVALLEGEPGLIDEADAFRGPGERGNHASPV